MTTQQLSWIHGPASISKWTTLRRFTGWRRWRNTLLTYIRLLVNPATSGLEPRKSAAVSKTSLPIRALWIGTKKVRGSLQDLLAYTSPLDWNQESSRQSPRPPRLYQILLVNPALSGLEPRKSAAVAKTSSPNQIAVSPGSKISSPIPFAGAVDTLDWSQESPRQSPRPPRLTRLR
jgi:hypothetical protein